MIKIEKSYGKIFNDLSWVLRARSKDFTIKPVVTNLLINNYDCICTDMHRMHIITIDEDTKNELNLIDGLYQLIKVDKKEIIAEISDKYTIKDFPPYKKVIPEKQEKNDILEVSFCSAGASIAIAKICKSQPGKCLNLDYLSDILRPGEKQQSISYDFFCASDNLMSPVRFDAENRCAVLMPIHIDI